MSLERPRGGGIVSSTGGAQGSAQPDRTNVMNSFRMVPVAFKRRAVGLGLAVAMLALTGTVGVTSAQAASANGGIYVVTPTWWGNCTQFGVAGLATWNLYVNHSNPGDYGDDVAWMPVRLNTSQSVQIKVICKRTGVQGGSTISATIRPTRNGQTFFFGADSRYWSN